jgi:DNA topoisomerase-2
MPATIAVGFADLALSASRIFVQYFHTDVDEACLPRCLGSLQVKDALTTRPSDFGTTCTVSSKVLKDVIKRSGVVDAVIDAAANADRSQLSRKNKAAVGNRKRDFINVPKLEDAVLAGTRRSNDCTLIITEGDSAKSLAVAGFEVVGRDK